MVLLVDGGDQRWVVKQALPRLRVAAEWFAKPERALTEGAALAVLGALTPGRVPDLLDVDAANFTVTMTAAPPGWAPWRDVLLHELIGDEALRVAATLGETLGRWHATTWHDATLTRRFDDYEAFEQLRVTPFHRVVARRHSEVARAVGRCVDDLLLRRDCLVHGDFSPKNVLVGADGLWVLDAEVAHVGAAVFDVAFLQCHLLLKAVHRPSDADAVRRCGASFTAAYARALARPASLARLGAQTACLLLARVDGSSPAGYLDDRARSRVRDLALWALREGSDLSTIWNRVIGPATDDGTDHHTDLLSPTPRRVP